MNTGNVTEKCTFIGYVPHNKWSFNGYHCTSNRLVPGKTDEKQTKRSSSVKETDIYQTRGTQICCITYSLFSLLKTPVYTPAKQSFSVVYCFQPVRHSIIPWFCQLVIPSTFKVFFCNLSNVCPILFKFSPHHM